MYGEKVKIKFILTIMVLTVFWGVNTAASVINQLMAKPVAPQLLAIDQKSGNFKLKLAGYDINFQDYKKIAVEAKNNLSPQARYIFEQLISISKLILRETNVYWRQLQGKFFFKDKWKSAILDIA